MTANEREVRSRVVLKHETEADWAKSSFVPKQNELVYFDPDELHPFSRYKIGDGETNVNELPFADCIIASDTEPELLGRNCFWIDTSMDEEEA